ncbi:Cell division protein ZapA [Clostridium vincentii]|uniref:Cell division protein ZapA n=2 Tax=Clostridium vincentii TaxID=52704 RepID=A0A2T0BGC3_9CLOT|nr:Cell division protein ZapA [Clostridium vincentii]
MIKVTVNINNREYNLKGVENEKYLKEVAEYVDSKIREITSKNSFLSTGDAGVLTAINIADELYKVDKEGNELRKSKKSLEERNQTLSDTIKELRVNVDKTQGEKGVLLNGLNNKINSLKDQISKHIEKNKVLEANNNSLNKVNITLKDETAKFVEELAQVNNLSEMLNREIVKVRDKNASLSKKLQQGVYAENSVKKELEKVVKEKETSKKIIDQAKYGQEVLSLEIKGLKKDKKELEDNIARIKNSKGSLEQELEMLNGRNSELKNEVSSLMDEMKGLQKKVNENEKEFEKDRDTKASMEEAFKENYVLEKGILEEDLEEKKKCIKELEDQVGKLSYEKSKIMNNNKESSMDLKTAKYRIMDFEKKLEDVQIEMAKMRKAKNALIK